MKRTIFAKIMLLALLTTAGCNTEGGSGQGNEDGSQYLGTWQRSNPNCLMCSMWVFSRTNEGGLLGEYYTSDGEKTDYAANYDSATKMLLIETGGGLKASLLNGALKMRSYTYYRVDGPKKPLL